MDSASSVQQYPPVQDPPLPDEGEEPIAAWPLSEPPFQSGLQDEGTASWRRDLTTGLLNKVWVRRAAIVTLLLTSIPLLLCYTSQHIHHIPHSRWMAVPWYGKLLWPYVLGKDMPELPVNSSSMTTQAPHSAPPYGLNSTDTIHRLPCSCCSQCLLSNAPPIPPTGSIPTFSSASNKQHLDLSNNTPPLGASAEPTDMPEGDHLVTSVVVTSTNNHKPEPIFTGLALWKEQSESSLFQLGTACVHAQLLLQMSHQYAMCPVSAVCQAFSITTASTPAPSHAFVDPLPASDADQVTTDFDDCGQTETLQLVLKPERNTNISALQLALPSLVVLASYLMWVYAADHIKQVVSRLGTWQPTTTPPVSVHCDSSSQTETPESQDDPAVPLPCSPLHTHHDSLLDPASVGISDDGAASLQLALHHHHSSEDTQPRGRLRGQGSFSFPAPFLLSSLLSETPASTEALTGQPQFLPASSCNLLHSCGSENGQVGNDSTWTVSTISDHNQHGNVSGTSSSHPLPHLPKQAIKSNSTADKPGNTPNITHKQDQAQIETSGPHLVSCNSSGTLLAAHAVLDAGSPDMPWQTSARSTRSTMSDTIPEQGMSRPEHQTGLVDHATHDVACATPTPSWLLGSSHSSGDSSALQSIHKTLSQLMTPADSSQSAFCSTTPMASLPSVNTSCLPLPVTQLSPSTSLPSISRLPRPPTSIPLSFTETPVGTSTVDNADVSPHPAASQDAPTSTAGSSSLRNTIAMFNSWSSTGTPEAPNSQQGGRLHAAVLSRTTSLPQRSQPPPAAPESRMPTTTAPSTSTSVNSITPTAPALCASKCSSASHCTGAAESINSINIASGVRVSSCPIESKVSKDSPTGQPKAAKLPAEAADPAIASEPDTNSNLRQEMKQQMAVLMDVVRRLMGLYQDGRFQYKECVDVLVSLVPTSREQLLALLSEPPPALERMCADLELTCNEVSNLVLALEEHESSKASGLVHDVEVCLEAIMQIMGATASYFSDSSSHPASHDDSRHPMSHISTPVPTTVSSRLSETQAGASRPRLFTPGCTPSSKHSRVDSCSPPSPLPPAPHHQAFLTTVYSPWCLQQPSLKRDRNRHQARSTADSGFSQANLYNHLQAGISTPASATPTPTSTPVASYSTIWDSDDSPHHSLQLPPQPLPVAWPWVSMGSEGARSLCLIDGEDVDGGDDVPHHSSSALLLGGSGDVQQEWSDSLPGTRQLLLSNNDLLDLENEPDIGHDPLSDLAQPLLALEAPSTLDITLAVSALAELTDVAARGLPVSNGTALCVDFDGYGDVDEDRATGDDYGMTNEEQRMGEDDATQLQGKREHGQVFRSLSMAAELCCGAISKDELAAGSIVQTSAPGVQWRLWSADSEAWGRTLLLTTSSMDSHNGTHAETVLPLHQTSNNFSDSGMPGVDCSGDDSTAGILQIMCSGGGEGKCDGVSAAQEPQAPSPGDCADQLGLCANSTGCISAPGDVGRGGQGPDVVTDEPPEGCGLPMLEGGAEQIQPVDFNPDGTSIVSGVVTGHPAIGVVMLQPTSGAELQGAGFNAVGSEQHKSEGVELQDIMGQPQDIEGIAGPQHVVQAADIHTAHVSTQGGLSTSTDMVAATVDAVAHLGLGPVPMQTLSLDSSSAAPSLITSPNMAGQNQCNGHDCCPTTCVHYNQPTSPPGEEHESALLLSRTSTTAYAMMHIRSSGGAADSLVDAPGEVGGEEEVRDEDSLLHDELVKDLVESSRRQPIAHPVFEAASVNAE